MPGAPRRPAGRREGAEGEANPWRRAAEAIEKERARSARSAAKTRLREAGEAEEGRRREDGRLAIGRLGAPRGVGGGLRVQSYSGETAHFLGLRRVELERSSAQGRATRLSLEVRSVEEGPGGLTMAFEGYPSPESAERLVGMELVVERSEAAPLAEGEWYVADLVGLDLVAPEGGRSYGRVLAVLEGGADPLLEILLDPVFRSEAAAVSEPGTEGRALVPFRKEFVGEIDVAAGRLVLLAPWILA